MSKKEYIVLQPKETIVDVEYSDGTVVRTNHRFWYEGEVAHLKFFVNDNEQVAELKQQLADTETELKSALEEIGRLEQQLAEKDKEIEKLKDKICELLQKDYEKAICLEKVRHQICEDIKIKGHYYHNSRGEEYYEITPSMLWEYATEKKINYVIDQVEKNEVGEIDE